MQFDSYAFLIFFLLFFTLYWWVGKNSLRFQNALLLGGSYVFYAWWDYRFLFLLIFSTVLDYVSGIMIFQSKQASRKFWLLTSICINLGFLGFFKYYNFFAESLASALGSIGLQPNVWSLQIILPVGISFYTFHGLSYVLDIYNRKIEPTRNFIDYSVFVSFFPLLVAGPIERATHLLPQVKVRRIFDRLKAADGLRQILWGLFKKIVVADNCATFANIIFNNHQDYNGATLVLGTVFFAFQIYGDFSGYSDIALGTARLLGFDLIRNFAFPYFSRDIAEFWRRWHISLSSWFRDYVYLPLGGSRGKPIVKIRNIFIIFLASGFWHGANWTFIVWGGLNALYYLPLLLFVRTRVHTDTVAEGKLLPSIREAGAIIITFSLTCLAWIFFRSLSLHHAFVYIGDLVSGLFSIPGYLDAITFIQQKVGLMVPLLMLFSVVVEWLGREEQFALARVGLGWNKPVRWSFYYSIIIVLILYGGKQQPFIYFQF